MLASTLEDVVSAIGKDEFGAALLAFANDRLPRDQCTAFAFQDSGRAPLAIVAQGEAKRDTRIARQLALEYVSGKYRHDPVFFAARALKDGNTKVLRLTLGDFESAEYRRQFYELPGIGTEVAVIGRYDGLCLYASFYRDADQPPFSDRELAFAEGTAALIMRLVAKHTELEKYVRHKSTPGREMSDEQRDRIYHHLRTVFLSECDTLTDREAEVCARIAMGYSVTAIASVLRVAPTTVATFRKHAYAKLNICSQNELFAHYFEQARQLQLC